MILEVPLNTCHKKVAHTIIKNLWQLIIFSSLPKSPLRCFMFEQELAVLFVKIAWNIDFKTNMHQGKQQDGYLLKTL